MNLVSALPYIQAFFTALLVVILLPALGYFLIREFTRKDKMEDRLESFAADITEKLSVAMNDVRDTVGQLRSTIEALRTWSVEKFVKREEFEAHKGAVFAELERQEKHTMRLMRWCSQSCPYRNGAPLPPNPDDSVGG